MVCSHAQASVLLWNISLLCHKTTFCFIFVLFLSAGRTRALNPEITLPWLGNEKWSWDRQLTSYYFYCQITRRVWFAMNGVGNSNSNGTLLLFGAWCCHNQFPQTITGPFGNSGPIQSSRTVTLHHHRSNILQGCQLHPNHDHYWHLPEVLCSFHLLRGSWLFYQKTEGCFDENDQKLITCKQMEFLDWKFRHVPQGVNRHTSPILYISDPSLKVSRRISLPLET